MFGLVSSVLAEKCRHVYTVEKTATVAEAVREMNEKGVGALLVMEGRRPIGIFTERDLLTNFLAAGRDLFTDVGTNCSQPLFIAASGISAHRAAAIMALKHIRRLPIVDEEKLVGIVTARDLVEAYAR